MATILQFRRSDDDAARTARPAEGSLGEIIIFPGVRIDRRPFSETPSESGAPVRRRAQRSRKK